MLVRLPSHGKNFDIANFYFNLYTFVLLLKYCTEIKKKFIPSLKDPLLTLKCVLHVNGKKLHKKGFDMI